MDVRGLGVAASFRQAAALARNGNTWPGLRSMPGVVARSASVRKVPARSMAVMPATAAWAVSNVDSVPWVWPGIVTVTVCPLWTAGWVRIMVN